MSDADNRCKIYFSVHPGGPVRDWGGYLVWHWMNEGKALCYGIVGGIILAGYSVVATFQPAGFGRVYATYGGFFIVMALLWAWKVDGFRPDRYDIIGALIALVGVCIIYYAPRS